MTEKALTTVSLCSKLQLLSKNRQYIAVFADYHQLNDISPFQKTLNPL